MISTHVASWIQLKNILYATDFSKAASAAFPYAAEFARRFGARFYAVHARTPDNYLLAAPEAWSKANQEYDKQENELRAVLRSDLPNIQTDVLTAEGGVWQVLQSVIDEKKIDLLVVGTRGRTGVGKFFLGSVAEDIVRRAPCPVLTVGPHSPSGPPCGGKFKKILYATDLSPESRAAAPYAVSLAQEHQAHLTLLCVLGKPAAGDSARPNDDQVGALKQAMRNLIPDEADLPSDPWVLVSEGDTAEMILDEARNLESDLIVMGVRKPEGLPGGATHLPTTAHKVIARAKCAVLTVRA